MATPLLTAEQTAKVLSLLHERHSGLLDDESFSIRARLERGTVVVELTLATADRTSVYIMEAAKAVPDDGALSRAQTLDLCLDFLDWYLAEYFKEQRELLLPLDWQPHRFGEFEVLARGDLKNLVLEEAADAWLRGERPELPASVTRSRRRR